MTSSRALPILFALLCAMVSVSFPAESRDPAAGAGEPLGAIRALIDQGRFAEAEAQSRELRSTIAAAQADGSVPEARVIDLLVESLWRSGHGADPETLELAKRAIAIKSERLGAGDAELGASLRNLGRLHTIRNETAEAGRDYERAIEVLSRQRGPEDPEVGLTRIFLGNLHLDQGDYAAAKAQFESALAIYRKAGPEIRVASILNNLGLLHYQTGDFAASRDFFGKALELKTKLGPDSMDVAWTLNSLANLEEETGEFETARDLYARALAIRKRALGAEHIYVALTSNNLGHVLHLMGDYVEAGRELEGALAVERLAVGDETPEVAMTLLNLARLLRTTGDIHRARELYTRSLGIREKILPAGDPTLADTLREVAAFHQEQGEPDQAEAMYRRALAMLAPSPAADPGASMIQRERAQVLDGLAMVMLHSDHLREAVDLFQMALAIREEAYGSDHPLVADTLEGLSLVHAQSGDLALAGTSARRVLAIRSATLGASHPLTARAQRDLGMVLARRHEVSGALEASLAAERIGREHLRLTTRAYSDRQALLYASVRISGLDTALRLAADGLDPLERRRVWESLMGSRAAVLDEMASRRRALAGPPGSDDVAVKLRELSAASRRLANLYVVGPDIQDPDRHYRLLDEALRQKEAIEQALAGMSPAFRRERTDREVRLDQLVQALPRGSALVAFARYDAHEKPPGPEGYLAFIATGRDAAPRVVSIGSAQEVEQRVVEWTSAVTRAAPARAAGDALRRLVWDPIAPGLAGASLVFLVPDGALNLVSFAALPSSRSSWLVETGPTFHYLSAERELLRAPEDPRRGDGLLAFGGPAFDAVQAAEDAAPARESFRGSHSSCAFFQGLTFPSLPKSRDEAEEVSAVWRRAQQGRSGSASPASVLLTGTAATEEAFKAGARGRSVLHLATHAFQLDGRCASAALGLRGIGGMGAAQSAQPPWHEGENPLLLAGLALAGANRRDAALPDQEDGILTAEEVAAMDLSSAGWVVLSACHTGGGEVRTGEGVLGLRRAFQVAGAGTLIMSLWPVDDEATRRWMKALYEQRFEKRLGTAEAVRQASLTILNRLRKSGEPPDPIAWAPFVSSGDWR